MNDWLEKEQRQKTDRQGQVLLYEKPVQWLVLFLFNVLVQFVLS